MKKISIKDIAKQAGVSTSTVSAVINGKARERRISGRVARQIETLAKKAGYRPNQTAVSLRTGKSKIIGLIVEDISDTFFSTLAKTIEDKAYSLGYRIVYCSTENDDEKGGELIKMLLHQQVDGFLITPSKGMDIGVAELLKMNKPVVLMDRFFPHLAAPNVLIHNCGAVMTGMDHLFERGYEHIAFVTVDLDQVQMREREKGYLQALEEKKAGGGRQLILTLPYDQARDGCIEQITAFIRAHPELDAIFFATNYLGIYGLESIEMLGLSIPEDVAVVCFDDHDIFRIFRPGITIIEQPIGGIAKAAIEMLINSIEGNDDAESWLGGARQVIMDTTLVIRGST